MYMYNDMVIGRRLLVNYELWQRKNLYKDGGRA